MGAVVLSDDVDGWSAIDSGEEASLAGTCIVGCREGCDEGCSDCTVGVGELATSLAGTCIVGCRGGCNEGCSDCAVGVGEPVSAVDLSIVLCREGPSAGTGRF